MVIHFFSDRSKPRIDFFQLIDGYFASFENCKITSDDNEVVMKFELDNFDFEYRYLITKRSRVSSLYRLNANFININLFCEIPTIIPQFLSRKIFAQINEICEKFDLEIYYDGLQDIIPFDMFGLINALGSERVDYLNAHPDIITYRVPMDKLNDMCNYQNVIDKLPSLIVTKNHEELIAKKYTILADKLTQEVKCSMSWKIGTPAVFPPHLDYVQIEEEDNLVLIVPIETFYKYTKKYMFEVKEDVVDFKLLYLNEHGALKAKKLCKKMRKTTVSLRNFDTIKITDLIEF